MTRSGIVTIAGKPNAGKSTLLNRLIGQKLAITSEKPQSTRDRIVGILTEGDTQFVISDTPGLLEPQYALQRAMRAAAIRAVGDADVIVYLVDASQGDYAPFATAAELAVPARAPVITAFNKEDLVQDDVRVRLRTAVPDALFVSAVTGRGIEDLLARIRSLLPEGPFLYAAEDASPHTLRYFAAEFIRETALEQLHEEVPYAVACGIEEFREGLNPVYIRAVLYVERASQKRILIGHRGSRIREIGRAARLKIEALLQEPVFLDLWVKVLDNWRRDANALRRLGYAVPEERKT
jgi:GTPase